MGRTSRQSKIDAREAETAKARAVYRTGGAAPHVDGWANFFTGLGITGRDKRTGAVISLNKLTYADCEALYRGSDMGARIVDCIPDEMTREGWEVPCENDSEASEAIEQGLDDLEAADRFNLALKWARAFGGAGIIVGADDGSPDVSLPLREDRVRSVEWLSVLDCRELVPWTYYLNPFSPNYGMPASYKIMPYNVGVGPGGVAYEEQKKPLYAGDWKEIHATRILRFEGITVNRYQMRETWGWGSSIFERILPVLQDFDTGYSSAAALLQDFAQAVMWIHGLSDAMSSNHEAEVRRRMELVQLQRSVLRAIMLDAGDETGAGREDFERKQTPVTGMPELLDRLGYRLAAAVDMPYTRLLGQQPAGLNATGDNDIRRWYDFLRSLQYKRLRPPLKRLIKMMTFARGGPTNGKVPKKWSVKFKPLWQLDDLQESQRRMNVATADEKYIANQVLTPEEVAATRFGGDAYNGNDMNLDLEARQAMETTDEEAAGESGGAEEGALSEPLPGSQAAGQPEYDPLNKGPKKARKTAGGEGPSSNSNPVGERSPV